MIPYHGGHGDQGRTHEGRWHLPSTRFSGFLPLNYVIACSMVMSLHKVDISHIYWLLYMKVSSAPPPSEKILGAPLMVTIEAQAIDQSSSVLVRLSRSCTRRSTEMSASFSPTSDKSILIFFSNGDNSEE